MIALHLSRSVQRLVCLLALLPCLLVAEDTVIRGHLADPPGQIPAAGESLVFKTDDGQTYKLEGDDYSTSQLSDPELKERHWELQGRLKPDGVFEILRLFTVKEGKLFRVTYFCVICNIRSYHHAPCMCCQDETELQEQPIAE